MNIENEEDYYTVEEFAKKLKMCTHTIRRAIRSKKIIAIRPGIGIKSPYRIPKIELERLAVKQMYENKNEQIN